MEKKGVSPGTKLDIKLESMLHDSDFSLKSTYEKRVNDTYFLITSPIKNGAPYVIGDKDRLYIECTENDVKFSVEGYVEEYVRKGIRTYLSVHRATPWASFISRADPRVKLDAMIKVEKKRWLSEQDMEIELLDARTLDMSAGGVALYVNLKPQVGEFLDLIFPKIKSTKELAIRGEVCWVRDSERGNPFRNIVGLRFFLNDKAEKERVHVMIDAMSSAAASKAR